jgi:hypothetical protein
MWCTCDQRRKCERNVHHYGLRWAPLQANALVTHWCLEMDTHLETKSDPSVSQYHCTIGTGRNQVPRWAPRLYHGNAKLRQSHTCATEGGGEMGELLSGTLTECHASLLSSSLASCPRHRFISWFGPPDSSHCIIIASNPAQGAHTKLHQQHGGQA